MFWSSLEDMTVVGDRICCPSADGSQSDVVICRTTTMTATTTTVLNGLMDGGCCRRASVNTAGSPAIVADLIRSLAPAVAVTVLRILTDEDIIMIPHWRGCER